LKSLTANSIWSLFSLFKENVLNKKDDSKVNFFHLGPANNWKDTLNEDVKNKIEKNFYNEMKELDYL
jgi:hypothetical protein